MKEVDKPTRCKEYLKLLKNGNTPATVVQYAVDEFKLSPYTARNEVYEVNAELYKSIEEVREEAANYVINALIGEIEKLENKPNAKIKAIDVLAKILKLYDVNQNVVLNNNYGFKFNDE